MAFSLAKLVAKVFNPSPKNVLELDYVAAGSFFLQHDSYSSIALPPYFRFTRMLIDLRAIINGVTLSETDIGKFKASSGVNYAIYSHKGDRYTWRKLQLINPVLYVKLVELMTDPVNWIEIQNKFLEFRSIPSIRCMSIPVTRRPHTRKLASQISSWVENVERESIRVSLKFEIMFKTDITNCYSSIYTHSVAWALHTKPIAKQRRRINNLGNSIDGFLQAMSNGQTNGIPEGSALMDFIAEMVLGYADSELSAKLNQIGISPTMYQIIRYRDDYRIFVREEGVGERILVNLAQVLMDLGLRLNSNKTMKAVNLVLESVKPAKLDSFSRFDPPILNSSMLRDELLFILDKGQHFPDTGFCKARLSVLIGEIKWSRIKGNEKEIIAIALNIALQKPDCFSLVATIISHLSFANSADWVEVFDDMQRKILLLPNSGLLEIWLQRIAAPHGIDLTYSEKLCNLMSVVPIVEIFPENWKPGSSLDNFGIPYDFVDIKIFNNLKVEVSKKEVLLFERY